MMNFIFRIIPLFLILGFVSCNKDLSYETINNRIIGEWSVGEVNFNPKGYGGKKNVTGNFKDLKYSKVWVGFSTPFGNSFPENC